MRLPETGQYALDVFAGNGTTTGAYSLKVWSVPTPDTFDVALAAPKTELQIPADVTGIGHSGQARLPRREGHVPLHDGNRRSTHLPRLRLRRSIHLLAALRTRRRRIHRALQRAQRIRHRQPARGRSVHTRHLWGGRIQRELRVQHLDRRSPAVFPINLDETVQTDRSPTMRTPPVTRSASGAGNIEGTGSQDVYNSTPMRGLAST